MPETGAGEKVYIIDDDPNLRKALVWLMESVGYKTAAFSSAVAFLEHWDARQRGCIVTDMRMPQMSGIELLKQLRGKGDETPVIMVTAHGTVPASVRAMKLGALDFLEKPFDEQALLEMVDAALADDRRRRSNAQRRDTLDDRLDLLSEREREVLKSVLHGLSAAQVARAMDISPKTVDTYRSRILDKTGFARMDELCAEIRHFHLLVADRREREFPDK